MTIEPFRIQVSDAVLQDLQTRLERTRWIDQVQDAGWNYGTNRAYMQQLVEYWRHTFDWRKQERKLNEFPQYRAMIDGYAIHFVHMRGSGTNPMPLLLTHGWPSSFFEPLKLAPLLSANSAEGAHAGFDLIIPSLPGFGFSDRPRAPGMSLRDAAELFAELMRELGYARFAAAGNDFGAILIQHLAELQPERLVGIHLTYIGYYSGVGESSNLSDAERQYLKNLQAWSAREGAYYMVQSTKPDTLGMALNDSPVGLAAWFVDKFRAWTDCEGDVEKRLSKDELLTNIMIYWIGATISSSMRTYLENPPGLLRERLPVPAAFASFPRDLNPPPRDWVERRLNLQQWTEMPRGGHFAALEEPELLATDMRQFFDTLR